MTQRVAVASWSSRLAGGVEDYLNIVIPSLQGARTEVAFWHEVDVPSDRSRIALPAGVPDFSAASDGAAESMRRLRDWRPDVLYVHGLRDVEMEAELLGIAPAVLFVHTYATCISGSKMFSRPAASPCDRKFGPACLVHYFPRGCGGSNPVTMWRMFGVQSQHLDVLRRYRAILTHSHHMQREMEKHGLRAHVIPFPVSNGAGSVADVAIRDEWRLVFAGRMESLKGGDLLIDALPEIAACCRHLHVTFAGDGRERAAWEAAANRALPQLPNVTVEFTGWLPESEINALMSHAHLLVVPSLWPEPFGSVGPMAAQHGLPAAAFASGGITEWLEEAVTGYLAPANPPTASGLARASFDA